MHEKLNTIDTVDSDEEKLCEIHKHPFGIVVIYIQAAIGMILAIGLAFFLLPAIMTDLDRAFYISSVFAAISVSVAFLAVLFATYIYRQNRLIVTERSITQILQFGLFNRKVSQLNLEKIEDVTSVQEGFIATILNFGTLKVETAGEQVNFHFSYCPNSGHIAKIILDARERMMGQMDSEQAQKKHINTIIPEIEESVRIDTSPNSKVVKDLGSEVIEHALDNNL